MKVQLDRMTSKLVALFMLFWHFIVVSALISTTGEFYCTVS